MGLLKKILGILGLAKDDDHEHNSKDDSDDAHPRPTPTPYRVHETGQPRRGFAVSAEVVVDRPQLGPVLAPSPSGDGGVQGLRWYAKRLRIDQDGDVADTFLEEVSSGRSAVAAGHHKKAARFKLKDGTRPVKVKQQVLSDGKVQHRVEHQGRLQLV
ncbi:uncharacterized protein LOC130740968 [Lotus japonicus]|uniref:uncharacterized protein LOC130740968 n=1 Tax=Lotus japonicus TaxID=34305 RepID=UPI0025869D5B|nr:uncharacterized protein LOC130740968 [Lotus japonicus]